MTNTTPLTRPADSGLASSEVVSSPGEREPARVWTVLERNWVYEDGTFFPAGTYPLPTYYCDRPRAAAECARLCQQFYEESTPEQFGLDWDWYFPERGPDFDPDAVTWDEMLAADFPEPYIVRELTAADDRA